MKLVAIETATGKRYNVSSVHYGLSNAVSVICAYKSAPDYTEWVLHPEEATLHVSTCMTDKNGREILDVDSLLDDEGTLWKVLWDGRKWRVLTSFDSWEGSLTPELAREMEVVS